MSTMGLVELVALVLFVGEEEVPNLLYVHQLQRLTGALESPVMNDLLGWRHVGVNWRSSRTVSRDFLDGPDLSLYKVIRFWVVGRGCGVLYVVMH